MAIKSILIFVFGIALLQSSGCALLARPSFSFYGAIRSYDGVSASHPGMSLAKQTVDKLAQHYPPGHTSITLVKAPGSFGDNLEVIMRQQGFAVLSPDMTGASGGVTLSYQLDEVAGENTCYLQVLASDGVRFGFVKSLNELAQQDLIAEPSFTSSSAVAASPLVSPLPDPIVDVATSEAAYTPTVHSGMEATSSKPPTTPLCQAVLHQLPSQWRYSIPDAAYREVLVSRSGKSNDWRGNISFAAEQAGCAASFDESARRVTIIAYDDALVPAVAPVVPSSTARLFLPASPALAALPRSPEPSSASVVTPSTPAAVSSALQDVSELPPLMAEPDNISILASPPSTEHGEQWVVNPGSLFAQLSGWCDRAGYQLVWKASHDLDMEAHAIFRGSFTEVIGRLFQGLHKSGNALRVTLYTANSVMEISEE